MAREALCFILLALLLPCAAALPAEGAFYIDGTARLPAKTVAEGHPVALCGIGSRDAPLEGIVLRASVVEVTRYRARSLSPGTPDWQAVSVRLPSTWDTYVLHNVTLTSAGRTWDHSYVGVDAVDARASAALVFAGAQGAFSSHLRSTIASWNATNAGSSDEETFFLAEVSRPHVLAKGAGALTMEAAGRVKLYGPTVRIEADENVTTETTGPAQPSPGVLEETWLVLRMESFSLEVRSAQWTAALQEGEARWEGRAGFRAVEGYLETDAARYVAQPGAVAIQGTFQSTFRPHVRDDRVLTALLLQGELGATTLATASVAAPVPADAGGLPWPGLVLGLAAVSTLAAGALLRRRHPRPRKAAPAPGGSSAEDCVARAEACLERGDLREALRWIGLARGLAPTSASACETQAFLLGELGRVDEALLAYREASRLSPADGEHALNAARLAHRAGRPPEVVEDLLEQALARDPSHVEGIEGDGVFDALAGRPRFDHMRETAWRRLVADLSEPDGS